MEVWNKVSETNDDTYTHIMLSSHPVSVVHGDKCKVVGKSECTGLFLCHVTEWPKSSIVVICIYISTVNCA